MAREKVLVGRTVRAAVLRLADHVLVVRQVLAGLRSAPLQACDLRHKDLPAYYEEWTGEGGSGCR